MVSSHARELFDQSIEMSFGAYHQKMKKEQEAGRLTDEERKELDRVRERIRALKRLVPGDFKNEPQSGCYDFATRLIDQWFYRRGMDFRFSPRQLEEICEHDMSEYRYISLVDTCLGMSNLERVIGKNKKLRVRLLDLSRNNLGDDFIPVFHRWFDVKTLQYLNLSNNSISYTALEPFFSELTFPQLKTLILPSYPGKEPALPSDDFKGLKIAFQNDHPDTKIRLL